MSPYRVATPPAGTRPRKRRFLAPRSIPSLLQLPFASATYMFFGMLVAFAFQAAILLGFRIPSGEACLCAIPYFALAPAGARVLVFRVGLDHDDDGAWPDGGVHTLHRERK